MIKAIIFDFFGVIEERGLINKPLLEFINDNLKPKYKIGILSNAAHDIKKYMSQEETKLFDEIVLSCEMGIIKPNTKFYELASGKLKVTANECAYVDDSVTNCEGAVAAGMQAIQYRDLEQLKNDLNKLLANPNN
jgi:epoxide hydrolase-like predicted phosphatase